MSVARILLTNDDGIDAGGIRAMYDALADEYEVTVVAPIGDCSSIGRALSHQVGVSEHDLGYAIDGTPADCVIAGLHTLVPDVDCVVAGCNEGANLGEYVLGRSGTVSAAVEATFFGVPAIATSMYVPGGADWRDAALPSERFEHATRATRFLVNNAIDAGVFDHVEYVNVNAPTADGDEAPMRVTYPSPWYEMQAERNGDSEIVLHDHVWTRMAADDVPDPAGTDRRAILDGEVSVSPLSAPHTAKRAKSLDAIVESYGPGSLRS